MKAKMKHMRMIRKMATWCEFCTIMDMIDGDADISMEDWIDLNELAKFTAAYKGIVKPA